MSTNIDLFNQIVGLVFGQLYEAFPIASDIDEEAIAKALGVEIIDDTPKDDWPQHMKILNFGPLEGDRNLRTLLYESMTWLRSEGFVEGDGQLCVENVRLTSKALLVLNASPAALSPTLGSRLSDAAKGAGTEGGRAVIAEAVGQVMGAVVKSLST